MRSRPNPKVVRVVCGIAAVGSLTTGAVAPSSVVAQSSGRSRVLIPRDARIDSTVALATFDSVWRTVGTSLADRGVTRVDWDAVRRELRPMAAGARSNDELRPVVSAMLRRVGESHFAVLPSGEASGGAPAPGRSPSALGRAGLSLRFAGGDLTVWRVDSASAAKRAGVNAGDVIDQIDDYIVPALEVRDSAGVRRTTVLTSAMRALAGDPASRVRLVRRGANGAREEIVFDRDSVRGPVSRFGNLPPLPASFEARRVTLDDGRCVGVMRFDYWLPPVVAPLDRAVNEMRSCGGIVIDLRGNLGGVAGMMMGVAGHFVNEVRPLGIMRTRGEEMRFVANPRRATDAGEPVQPFAGPLAIVVDGLSASTSEMFAAALQSLGRARVFGERTAGQALPAVTTRLPNGDVLMHVVADFVAPNGARIEGTGVNPDEVVPLRRSDLQAGRDGALEAALRWIERARPNTATR